MTVQLFSKNRFVLEGLLTSCSFDYLSRDLYTRIYMLLMIIFGFSIPLAFIITFYILTRQTLQRKSIFFKREMIVKKSASYEPAASSLMNATMASEADNQSRQKRLIKQSSFPLYNSTRQFLNKPRNISIYAINNKRSYDSLIERERKVLKTIILNVTFFLIAWFPYAFIVLLAQFGGNIEIYITPLTTSLPAIFAKFSSIYNPLLYTLTNDEFKNILQEDFVFQSKKSRKTTKSELE